MMNNTETELRTVAALIQSVREECCDRIRLDIENEMKEMERSGADPTGGRGRGPMWADGACK